MKKIPVFVKILICLFCPPFVIIWILSGFFKNSFSGFSNPIADTNELVRCMVDMSNNPCNDTVSTYLETRARVKITVGDALDKYEKNWPVIWEKVNDSNKVTSELKLKLRDHLMYSGKLYLANPDIVDNYQEV